MKWMVLLSLLAGAALSWGEEAIPAGTILPVSLQTTLRSEEAQPGKLVVAKIAQEVALPSGKALRVGTKVLGHIAAASQKPNAQIALVFDKIEIDGKTIPIRTDLRAMAGFMEVEAAQIPAMGADRGTPASAWTTVQIGGDVVYRGGGPVARGVEVVGKPVAGGVLVKPLASNDCRSSVAGNDTPQALWVFSADACGVYGMEGISIAHTGRTEQDGEFVIGGEQAKLKVPGGTGMLLRTN